MTGSKKRVQFIFPAQAIDKLDQLKEAMGASSRTEVLRTSIELLSWATAHIAEGEEIAAVREGDIMETIALPGVSRAPRNGRIS